ncbi:hypothetical protein PanWU01x14_296350 [Parasponia andersonii]|uniref:Uncharacterized protein n=1 Tax=Parasponia andersonii TaxID=3476 RepID=A0A2P5AVM6_PARAD|nr:hypothetical protein PanWU01x14_296350 [Parasponia andersonii]
MKTHILTFEGLEVRARERKIEFLPSSATMPPLPSVTHASACVKEQPSKKPTLPDLSRFVARYYRSNSPKITHRTMFSDHRSSVRRSITSPLACADSSHHRQLPSSGFTT